ncbi:HlyD family type I secretion periplasmic adaptor subunit [Paenibacillus sp. YSY-4.3]
MRAVIRDMGEITDSREIMEARTSPFISIFLGFLVLILVVGLIWASISKIDIVVKASGVVRPNEKVSRIQSKATGNVESVHYMPGQKVKAGDVLYTLHKDQIEADKLAVELDVQKAKAQLEELVQFRGQILAGKMSGNLDTAEQSERLSNLLDGHSSKQKFHVELTRLMGLLEQAEEKQKHLQLLKQSVAAGTNLLPPASEYYYKFQDYQIKKEQYALQEETASELFKMTVRQDGDDSGAKQKLEEVRLQASDYANGFEMALITAMNENDQLLNKLQGEVDALYLQLAESIESEQEHVKSLEERLQNLDFALRDYVITAPIDGTVNVITDINAGDLLQTGTELLTILPENDSEFMMKLAISNSDVANINVGDTIKYSFIALPSNDYGMLEGTVRSIGGDAVISQQDGYSYYAVEADIQSRSLRNKKGEEAYIKTGMMAEAQIITRSETVLEYMLKKLDLKQ